MKPKAVHRFADVRVVQSSGPRKPAMLIQRRVELPRARKHESAPVQRQTADSEVVSEQTNDQLSAIDEVRGIIDSGVSDFDILFQKLCQNHQSSGEISDVFDALFQLLGKNPSKLSAEDRRRWRTISSSIRGGSQFKGQMDKLQHFIAGAGLAADYGESVGRSAGWLVEKFDTVKALWGDITGTRESWQVGFDWNDFEWTAAGAAFADLFTDLEKPDRQRLLGLFADGTLKASQIYQPVNLGAGMLQISPAFTPWVETNIDKVDSRIDAMVNNLRAKIKERTPKMVEREEDQLRTFRKVFIEQEPAYVEWFFRRLHGM